MRNHKEWKVIFLLTGLLMSAVVVRGQRPPSLNVREYKLNNGLTVVLHEDHSTPIVSVNVLYKVGFKNETPSHTEFAHLFEHLVFSGSPNHLYREPGELGGGIASATTSEDRTYYYSTVPSNYLERVLFLQADRMNGLVVDQAKLDNQRDIVRNELRQFDDNTPYGTMHIQIDEIMYPKGHPYHDSVTGRMNYLAKASLDEVRSFYGKYYLPNNVVLTIAGDLDEKQTRKWVEKYFGPIKRGASVQQPNAPQPQLAAPVRRTVEDPFANVARMTIAWEGVPRYSADDAALEILDFILSYDRGSRLQDSLVYKNDLATETWAFNQTRAIGGTFQVTAMARPGRSVEELEKAIDVEIDRIKHDGVSTREVGSAIAVHEARMLSDLQTAQGRGDRLAEYTAFVGKADYLRADVERFRRVTTDDIRRVANRYLTANRLVLSYVPAKAPAPPGRADPPTTTPSKEIDPALRTKQEAMRPKPGPEPLLRLPQIQKAKLSNGLEVWLVERHALPIVTLNLVVKAGASSEAADKAGLASITAMMLAQGTCTRSASEIASGFSSLGAIFHSENATWDSNWLWMQSTVKGLDIALNHYSDIAMNASFPEVELRVAQERVANWILQRGPNATGLGGVVFDKLVYGDQPYGRQLSGDEKTVGGITRDDVLNFYNSYYRPNNSTLIIVGDVRLPDIKIRLEKAFAGWKPGNAPAAKLMDQQMIAKPGIYLIDKPTAVQSSIKIGGVGVERGNPDFDALEVMNSILGWRLTRNLRQVHGYSYRLFSSFDYRDKAGPFSAWGEVQLDSTKEAVQEFINEINGIRGRHPITPAELQARKQVLIQLLPRDFGTVGGTAARLAALATFSLSDDYYNSAIPRINAVTVEDVYRVANKYLDTSKMIIVIVGDRSIIEPKIRELGTPVTIINSDGKPIQ